MHRVPIPVGGTLEDAEHSMRAIARRLSVGVGDDIKEAVRNGMSDQALYANDIATDWMDSWTSRN